MKMQLNLKKNVLIHFIEGIIRSSNERIIKRMINN
jgi:hypothetical protein